jgi:hypothetical protein
MAPMGENAIEAMGSMGDDTPLAVLSDKPRLLYDYFKQLFASGHQPADRRDPRGNRHRDGNYDRSGRQLARSAAESAARSS